ncbi:dTDP-4-dehydrorhamnose reductase [Muricauda sp. JGD-17]|uniref:dTDP-4-dehydrorhamnose reductase n=1 Tax=Flagellimonas ochracea TaxID=2696472 RepID=A0A964WXC2_9FLAO|nr:dTDP-4-dehydrorhamnose reductase [Allomuricauda ochracea]NAY91658.1 dTDP-4-dehydrorhamnose reductase [Allomuricauda ochracea]
MKKVLVTGSKGQLGQTLQEYAFETKDIVFSFKGLDEVDIVDKNKVNLELGSNLYDYCINCAAYTDVEKAEQKPDRAFEINSEGVKNLALACKQSKTILVHISTDYVFDGEKEGAYTIQDIPNPINEYGKSKLKGEEYIRTLLPNHYIVRTSWLYSKKYGHNFYRTVVNKARAGEELRITDMQIGTPTETDNLSRFLLNEILMGNKPFGTYHFSDGNAMSWYDFAKKILQENKLADTAKLILDRNYHTFARRPKNSVLS